MNGLIKINELIYNFCDDYNYKEIELEGNKETIINGLNLCNRESGKKSILTYATSEKYLSDIKKRKNIKALIVNKENKDTYKDILYDRNGILILTNKPESLFYKIHEYLYSKTDFYDKYDFDYCIGEKCNIAGSAIIERGVTIGNNVIIGENTVIKHGSIIDDNVTIGCNSTIGSEGFQLITDSDLPPVHVTHIGRCHLCKNVYVGDNSCVCNSLFEGETYIGENVKIDNLVHVAHNLYIGKNAVVTAHVILCGSARIEEGAWIAPNSSVLNKVVIGPYALVGMGSVVIRDVPPHATVYGNPAKEHSSIK